MIDIIREARKREMVPISLHIVVLDCDTPVPNVYAERGTYADIFEALLRDAAVKTPGVLEVDLEFSSYDCVRGHLPSIEDLHRVDGAIITGSGAYLPLWMGSKVTNMRTAASAYDDAPWIKALLEFTQGTISPNTSKHLFD